MCVSPPNQMLRKADPVIPVNRLRFPLLICILLFGSSAASEPYSFQVTVDKDSITVGDPFVLTLSLEHQAMAALSVDPDVRLPETFRVQEMMDAVREETGDGRARWTQSIRLTSYRPGEAEIPVIRVKVSSASEDTTELSDEPIPILVQSVKPEGLTDILDVKQPVSIESVLPVWVWASILALAVALAAYFLWWRRRASGADETHVIEVVDWFAEVRKLRGSGLIASGDFDTYYTRLSEALRRFIEQRTKVEAMERTTHEIRGDLIDTGMTERGLLDVEHFLNHADLVKFAKFEPDAACAEEDCDAILALMGRIDEEFKPSAADESVDDGRARKDV
jgi:hypothetical protein